MSTRRIARKLALIILPLLPQSNSYEISDEEIETYIARATNMLSEHAKQLLENAAADLTVCFERLADVEEENPVNRMRLENLDSVPVKTDELRKHYEKIELAINLVNEALAIPELALHAGKTKVTLPCSKCKQVSTVTVDRGDRSEVREFIKTLLRGYMVNRDKIDQILKQASKKWKVERMVSTDRDILRLASLELFFMSDIPTSVAINEAIELCHQFADRRAAKFINGVLADLVPSAEYFRQTEEIPLHAVVSDE